ncbi:MAG: 50S ribosomal protein L29 [Chloroflexi bacterium]|nr:50S ribosomal protein L29 [Chloroflexota bacterium]
MEIDDLRKLNDADLRKEYSESLRGLMNLRFRQATMQLANTNEIRKAKKRIARLLTLIGERQLTRT